MFSPFIQNRSTFSTLDIDVDLLPLPSSVLRKPLLAAVALASSFPFYLSLFVLSSFLACLRDGKAEHERPRNRYAFVCI